MAVTRDDVMESEWGITCPARGLRRLAENSLIGQVIPGNLEIRCVRLIHDYLRADLVDAEEAVVGEHRYWEQEDILLALPRGEISP